MYVNNQYENALPWYAVPYEFFVKMWCVSGPEEWLADELESSSHTPARYRVLGTLQSSEDFAKSWSCPPGSRMNPIQKCNSLRTSAPLIPSHTVVP
jgi:hypothetical protein